MELSGKLTKMAARFWKIWSKKMKEVTFVFAFVSLPSLKTSQAGFPSLVGVAHCSPVAWWRSFRMKIITRPFFQEVARSVWCCAESLSLGVACFLAMSFIFLLLPLKQLNTTGSMLFFPMNVSSTGIRWWKRTSNTHVCTVYLRSLSYRHYKPFPQSLYIFNKRFLLRLQWQDPRNVTP